MIDIQRHLQLDIVNLNKEVFALKKQNQQLQMWIDEFKEIILNNISRGTLLSLISCNTCEGSGHIWPDDACKCCDAPLTCVKCKGEGHVWGKLCG